MGAVTPERRQPHRIDRIGNPCDASPEESALQEFVDLFFNKLLVALGELLRLFDAREHLLGLMRVSAIVHLIAVV